MILELRLPDIVPQMTGATAECLFAEAGEALRMGSKLIDLRIDLSSAFAQECPPVSYYRIVVREKAYLRHVSPRPGDFLELDAPVALFSSSPDEPLETAPERRLRVTVAGILHHDGMFSGGEL